MSYPRAMVHSLVVTVALLGFPTVHAGNSELLASFEGPVEEDDEDDEDDESDDETDEADEAGENEDEDEDDESEDEGETADSSSETEEESSSEEARRRSQWQLHLALGGEFVVTSFRAGGPNIRLGAWAIRWRKKFMVGGGPVLHYSMLFGTGDRLHFATLDGDLLLGGGKQGKFAAYGHILLGGGVIAAKDGQTATSLILPGIRLAVGAGAHGHLTPKVTLGGLVDFGYFGGLGVDAYLTLGFLFG